MAVTLKEKAYNELKRMILGGEVKPSDFLTERALVERLGMSRTPIRSALERLDVEGIIDYIPNKGLVIAEMSIARAVDIYDYRSALESHIVKRLADRGLTPDETAWLEENLAEQAQYAEAQDHARFTDADARFHAKLTEIYGNREMIQAMEQLQDKLYQIAMNVLRKDRSRIRISYEDHLKLFRAIASGDAALAVQLLIEHLEFGKRILIS